MASVNKASSTPSTPSKGGTVIRAEGSRNMEVDGAPAKNLLPELQAAGGNGSEEDEFCLDDNLLPEDRSYQTAVSYPKYDVNLASQIIDKIEAMIEENKMIPDGCGFRCEYGQVRGDASRLSIIVSFDSEEAVRHFNAAQEVLISVEGRGVLRFPIVHESKWVSRNDGRVLFFVKKMPASINLSGLKKILCEYPLRKDKVPYAQEVVDLEFLKHKGSKVCRGMAAGYLVPRDDDPDCSKIPGHMHVRRRKPSAAEPNGAFVHLIFGCDVHVCDTCGRKGHLKEVCNYWPEKARGKKRVYSETLENRVFMDESKVPNTPFLQKAKEDFNVQFLEGKGFSRQAWICTGCPKQGERIVQGDSYHGLGLHLESARHKETLRVQAVEMAEFEADQRGETEEVEEEEESLL